MISHLRLHIESAASFSMIAPSIAERKQLLTSLILSAPWDTENLPDLISQLSNLRVLHLHYAASNAIVSGTPESAVQAEWKRIGASLPVSLEELALNASLGSQLCAYQLSCFSNLSLCRASRPADSTFQPVPIVAAPYARSFEFFPL